MGRHPKIPMLPEELPEQAADDVVELPDRPPGFLGRLHDADPLPAKHTPTGAPRNKIFLGGVEWAFGPASSRFDAYYLNPRGPYWLLWNYQLDENMWVPRRKWSVYAYGPRKGISEKEAAVYLLMDAWKADGVGHYYLIDDTDFLSTAEFSAIAQIVWPGEGGTRE